MHHRFSWEGCTFCLPVAMLLVVCSAWTQRGSSLETDHTNMDFEVSQPHRRYISVDQRLCMFFL